MLMKSMINAHALNALIKPVDNPSKSLAVADDEKHSSIPILIFTEQYLTQPKPEIQNINDMSFEKMQKPGTGASLALEDFETQAFEIGNPFGGV